MGGRKEKPAPWGLLLWPALLLGPHPCLATPSPQVKAKDSRTWGCSHCLFASLGKSRTSGPCHTSEAEGQQGHFSGGLQLEDSRRKRGSHGHCPGSPQRRPLPLPPRGRAASGSRLRPEAAPRTCPRHQAGPLGEGPRWDLTDHSSQVRVCEPVRRCADVPLGARGCIQVSAAPRRGTPHPSPLPARGGQAHVGQGSERGSPAEEAPCPGLHAPRCCPKCAKPSGAGGGLISGVQMEGPSTLVQAGPGQPPPGSPN